MIDYTRQALAARIEAAVWSLDASIWTDDDARTKEAWARLDAILADIRSEANPYQIADGENVTAAEIGRRDAAAAQTTAGRDRPSAPTQGGTSIAEGNRA